MEHTFSDKQLELIHDLASVERSPEPSFLRIDPRLIALQDENPTVTVMLFNRGLPIEIRLSDIKSLISMQILCKTEDNLRNDYYRLADDCRNWVAEVYGEYQKRRVG